MTTNATVPTSDLPGLDNLPNFIEFGNQLTYDLGTINGNVGISQGGTLNLLAPATINGDVYLAPLATLNQMGVITGSTFDNQDLTTEQNAVVSASAVLAGLTPDETITANQTTGLSFNVPAGEVYVVNLVGGLNLNDQNITLTGGGSLVLNIQNSLSFAGSASVLGDPANIYINYLGTSTVTTQIGSTINGLLFNADAAANLTGVWNGALFSASGLMTLDDITLNPVPEPKELMMAGFAAFLFHLARRRLSRP